MKTENLKNWETDTLTAVSVPGLTDFQNFRFPPLPPPKSCRTSPDGVEVEAGNVLNVLNPGPLGLAYINNRLMS